MSYCVCMAAKSSAKSYKVQSWLTDYNPCPTAVHMEPFPFQSSKLSFATTAKIYTTGGLTQALIPLSYAYTYTIKMGSRGNSKGDQNDSYEEYSFGLKIIPLELPQLASVKIIT